MGGSEDMLFPGSKHLLLEQQMKRVNSDLLEPLQGVGSGAGTHSRWQLQSQTKLAKNRETNHL